MTHEQLADALGRDPFVPIVIATDDGRRIEVRRRDQAVLNSLAVSVVEAPFSVTVIGISQIESIGGA